MIQSTILYRIQFLMSSPRFRYARCQLDFLCAQRTGRSLIRALERIPDDLTGIYTLMINRIPRLDREMVREALLWLSHAQQPMSLAGLCEAVVLEEGDSFLDAESRLEHPEILLTMCEGLVSYDEVSSEIVLAHSTVRKFLTSDEITCGSLVFYHMDDVTATRIIFRKCLRYLMFDEFKQPCKTLSSLKERLAHYPLLDYAAKYWAIHSGFRAPTGFLFTPDELNDIITFFNTHKTENGGNFTSWVQVLISEAPPRVARESSPLYYAASFGLLPVVEKLIENGACVDVYGGRAHSTPLQVACFRNYLAVVRVLLAAGADPNSTNQFGISNLAWARKKGFSEIEKLLLENGADDLHQSTSGIYLDSAKTYIGPCRMCSTSVIAYLKCCNCGHIICSSRDSS
jgi:Ankyrin repeats (3 copies)